MFELLHNMTTVKTRTNVRKCRCFQKSLRWRVANFFGNEVGTQGGSCNNVFQLIYEEVSIYLKYRTPHLLLKIVKTW